MICDNLSSSTSTPPTEFILTAIREKLIHYINPGKLSPDIDIGRKIKEDMINSITHEKLEDIMSNYFDMEASISELYGNRFIDYLIGNIDMTIVPTKKIPSVILYTDSYTITSSSLNITPVTIEENENLLEDATILWTTMFYPVGGTVAFDYNNVLSPILTFSIKGSYVLNVTIKWIDFKVAISQNIIIDTTF